MHCKYCGELNEHKGNYCKNCGKKIKNFQSNEIKGVDEIKSAFCKKCGEKIVGRYCNNCGTSTYSLELKQSSKFKTSDFSINKDTFENIKSKVSKMPVDDMKSTIKEKVTLENAKVYIKNNASFKNASFSALIMLGVGLLISFILMSIVKGFEPIEYILNEFRAEAEYLDPQMLKLIPNFIDFFNLSMLSPMYLSMNVKEGALNEGVKVVMQLKLIVLMFIPVLAVILGQLKQFKNDKSTSENLAFYSLTALIFSIALKIISIVTAKNIAMIFTDYGIVRLNISMGFGSIMSILSVFLFVLIIQMVISGLIKRDNPFELLKINKIGDLSDNLLTYIKSMSVLSLIITISIIIAFIFIKDDTGGKVSTILISSLFYIPVFFTQSWLFSSGFGLQTNVMDKFPIDLNIWKSFGWLKESAGYMGDTNLIWAYLVIIGSLLGIAYVVYNSVKDIEKDNKFFLKIGTLAGFIIIFNILLSYLVNIGFKVKNISSSPGYDALDLLKEFNPGMLMPFLDAGIMSQGYVIATIIVTILIWVFVIGAIVYFLKDKEIFERVGSFIDDNNKIVLLIYSLFMVMSFSLALKEFSYILPKMMQSIIPLIDLFF